MAMKRFKDEGFDDRLKALGASILEEDFPSGHDCILFCHFIANYLDSKNRQLMRRAYEAVEPGGFVCVYAPFMNNDECGHLISALLSPYFLCTSGMGRHYSWKEATPWLENAGFVNITKDKLVRSEGVVMGLKP